MSRFARKLTVVAVLALAVGFVGTTGAADDDDAKLIKEAQKEMNKRAKKAADKGIPPADVTAAKKFEELNTYMHAYKPKEKGGFGVGDNAKSGIEFTILEFGKRAPAKMTIEKREKELLEMAYR